MQVMATLSVVEFHSGVADAVAHAVKLLRKASTQGARVAVIGAGDAVDRLDASLWTDQQRDFIAHACWRAEHGVSPRMRRTPIWLIATASPHETLQALSDCVDAGCTVVVNLDAQSVEHPGVHRLIEVVSNDQANRQAGRQRWRAHEALGRTIEHHAIGGA
jgi:DNA polymerase III subunit chi